MNFSVIFPKFNKPEIFLNLSTVLGGYSFGTGVTVSIFQILAYSPVVTEQLIITAIGVESSAENYFIILAGTSFFTVDAFVLILLRYS